MSYRTARIIARLCLLAILLSIIVFAAESCSTKKKATERFRQELEFDKSKSVSSRVQNNLQRDCTAVQKLDIDWTSIRQNINFELIDPNQEGYANVTPDGKGGLNFTGKNTRVTSAESRETKKESRQDSITKKESDTGSQELDTSSTESGQQLDTGRNSDSEATRWPFWFLLVPVVLGVLIYFRSWKFWK